MAMVATGLGLTLWQVLRGRGNLWLLTWNTVLLAVLYGASFVNFAQVFAAENLSGLRVLKLDRAYLCALGPNAAGALNDYRIRTRVVLCPSLGLPRTEGWRDWGFRKARVRGYVGGSIAGGSAGA